MKTIITLGILALVVAAGVFYQLFWYMPSEESDYNEMPQLRTSETTQPESGAFSGKDTLQALVERGEQIECSISYEPNQYEGEISGTYFVADGNVRGDFLIPATGEDRLISTSIITDSEAVYVWSEIDGQLYGTKTSLSENVEVNDAPVPSDASVTYDCKPWPVLDGSIFEPPSGVLFRDTAELQQTGMEYGTVYEEGEF